MRFTYNAVRATAKLGRWLLLGALLAGSQGAVASDVCEELKGAIPRLTGGAPLSASAVGQSYEQLFDGCDRTDTFAGHPLPMHEGRTLRCSTDPNRLSKLVAYPDGTIHFSAKAAVDADGSKVACGTGWPNQCGTWLSFDAGSERHDVNAEDTPFVVVPGAMPATGISFQKDAHVRAGDLAVVVANGKCSFGVVGDSGPYFRLGELSLKSHEELGNPQCVAAGEYPCAKLKGGGSGVGIASGVEYIIFPNTRPQGLFSQNVNAKARESGERRLLEFLSRYSPK